MLPSIYIERVIFSILFQVTHEIYDFFKPLYIYLLLVLIRILHSGVMTFSLVCLTRPDKAQFLCLHTFSY